MEPNAANPMPNAAPQPTGSAPVMPPVPKSDGSDLHSMVVMQPGETLVCDIKRHPFGIVSLYVSAGLGIVAVLILAMVFVPKLSDSSAFGGTNLQPIAYMLVALFVIGAAVITAVSSRVYWENRWIVTSDSITQITQNSLFGRRSSQLSLDNLEDVTVDQTGLLQHMFDFGTLRVETAGERSKFFFQYCPHPTACARQILIAREDFMNHKQYKNDGPEPANPNVQLNS